MEKGQQGMGLLPRRGILSASSCDQRSLAEKSNGQIDAWFQRIVTLPVPSLWSLEGWSSLPPSRFNLGQNERWGGASEAVKVTEGPNTVDLTLGGRGLEASERPTNS